MSITLIGVMLVFLFCSPTLYAQKISALIYADKNQKNADTIDFGVVLYEDNLLTKNTTTTRFVYIENTGEVPLVIPSIIAPYFITGQRIITSFEHLEFSNAVQLVPVFLFLFLVDPIQAQLVQGFFGLLALKSLEHCSTQIKKQ